MWVYGHVQAGKEWRLRFYNQMVQDLNLNSASLPAVCPWENKFSAKFHICLENKNL